MSGDLFDILDPSSREKLPHRPHPHRMTPMLATLTDRRFSDPSWLYERKFDGVRCLVFRHGKDIQLVSRNRRPLNPAYPELVEAFREQDADDFVVDGEIVAFKGKTMSFAQLQGRMGLHDPIRSRATGIVVYLYLFDALYAEGHDLTGLPLSDRKEILQQLLTFNDPLRQTVFRRGGGKAAYAQACRRGWEGLIAKRLDATYQGGRSHDWLKMKCSQRQEFVIVGFTDPQRSRVGLGALLLGYNEGGALRYAGKVGTGFNTSTLESLRATLERIERPEPPVSGTLPPIKSPHWVRPSLVGEIAFAEWTRDGRLRHPRFLGLRQDKSARQVVRERATA